MLPDFSPTDFREILGCQISSVCQIVPCGRTDRHEEGNSRVSQFSEALKKEFVLK
jgi:hypothetical protein